MCLKWPKKGVRGEYEVGSGVGKMVMAQVLF